ncbi:MAG: hypothetical protein OEW69_09270 [Nitrospirota bacterium]|nr:hypothetical protein [Nitrospirota bacterium]
METTIVKKLLKDYPLNQWLEAADGCQYCKKAYQVRVTWVDESGNYGDLEIKEQHEKSCIEQFEPESHSPRWDTAGWEFTEKEVTILEHTFRPIKLRMNVGPCVHCWKLVVGIPLILFIDEGKGGEIDLCFSCAEKLGVLDQLKKKGDR